MIEVKNVFKSYGEKNVLNNINIFLEDGGIYALVGKNGVGKTTLLNAIGSPVYKDSGEVFIDNVDHNEFKTKYNLFYVTSSEVFLNYTVGEYIYMIRKMYKTREKMTDEIINHYLLELELENEWDKYLSECSYGTKKKVYLLGAIVSNANNLLLDEPFNGLDPMASEKIRSILKEFTKEGKLIFLSSHNLDMICNYVDKIIFMGKEIMVMNNPNNYDLVYKKFEEICEISKEEEKKNKYN